MPLTPEEQQEMAALQKQLGPQSAPSGLTPAEQQEMEMLQKQLQPQKTMVQKGVDFASNFPTSAIDMIPGMKQKRQVIQQQRSANSGQPSDIPGMTQGQRQDSFKQSAQGDMNSAINLVGSTPMLGLGKVAGGLEKFLAPAAQRSEVLSKVKNVSELEPYVQGKINEAAQNFNKYEIAPKMVEQKAMMGGGTVKVDPAQLQGLSPEIDTFIQQYPTGEIPADKALELRAKLNDVAGWKLHPMDQARAKATNDLVASQHQALTQQFSDINPNMATSSDELQKAYLTRNQAIGNAGKNPIGSVLQSDSSAGLTKKGRLERFDQGAGSNLSQLGKDIGTANDKLSGISGIGLSDFMRPSKLATKAFSPASRSYDAAAEAISPTLSNASQAAEDTSVLSPSYATQLSQLLKMKSQDDNK